VEMDRVVNLKDVITNYVTAQIRTATTLPGNANTQTIWTSQPGAIRTYHGSNTSLCRVYKLYSSDKMLIENIQSGRSGALLNEIEHDVEPQWDQYPDMYVDLNRPVRPSSSERDSSNAAKIKARLIYPIADPLRYNGQPGDKTKNTEGFVYGENSLSSRTINGVDNRKGQLAMPVRWIYLLRDGTPGTVDKEGKFNAMGKEAGEPSRENPIVSRLGWWTDDESCKINVNTASLPIPWDNPRTASGEDLWYAQHQPVSGECQHYPGHPSQTDLCAVFFPGNRYSPDTGVMPIGEMNLLPLKYAQMIWNITPFVTETGGSFGGTQKVFPLSARPVVLDRDDHLFATYDELYFKARNADKNLDRPRDTVGREDVSGELLERIEGSQFFLTTRSNGPEMTVYGTPRVCMFPMNYQVVAEVGKEKGAVNPAVGAFEVTMATNATIGAKRGVTGKAFYFQREENASSRHNNFYNSAGGRNARVFKYLKKLTLAIPPGYPELSAAFNTFGKKYPGPNGTDGNIPLPDKVKCDFDSSDRTQIVLSMLDLMRSSNMSPGYLESGKSYDNGGGQVAGICGCNRMNTTNVQQGHTTALKFDTSPSIYTPKGSGRTYGPAEILFFAHVIATKREGQGTTGVTNLGPRNPEQKKKWDEAKAASLIQIGVLINAFSPRQGWAPLFAESGINLSNGLAASGTDPRTLFSDTPNKPTQEAPFLFATGGSPEMSVFLSGVRRADGTFNHDGSSPPAVAGGNPPTPIPPNFIPWAGIAGARVTASKNVATFDPVCFDGPGAGSKETLPVQLKWKPGQVLRVFLYDGPPADYNTVQAIEIDLGAESLELSAAYTGISGDTLLQQALREPQSTFPPNKVAITSLVVPHGDYRLTTTPMRVERGIFVPYGNGSQLGHAVVEPVLTGSSNARYIPCGSGKVAAGLEGLLADSKLYNMDPGNAPHFAPITTTDFLCREDLGTKPVDAVFKVASSIPTKQDIRRFRFAHGRRDGGYSGPQYKPFSKSNLIPNRGSSDPLETGDFDNGIGLCPDGAYMNQPDDGDARDPNMPYYMTLGKLPQVNPATFSPNRVLRSAVDFGSVPNGLQARVPWQTLRFRPDPGMYDPQNKIESVNATPHIPSGYQHYFPFSNYCGPKDHLLLDMWWMPVVEPWSISEGFATKGLINLNQQIYPFTYIQRTTALHALLRSERMMAIPDSASQRYKNGAQLPNSDVYRHWINAKETLRQLTEFRWKGQDSEGFSLPFNSFRSASEICELWLVPEKNGVGDESGPAWTLDTMIKGFWETHRLTGDNMRERPYANLYPRLTVRSNVFRVHMVAQTLKQASTNKPETFKSSREDSGDADLVTAEWRGSALVERVLNPNEPELQKFDYAPTDAENVYDGMNITWPAKLDNFYTYRVTEVKQFTE
jgi:hypothetical protein